MNGRADPSIEVGDDSEESPPQVARVPTVERKRPWSAGPPSTLSRRGEKRLPRAGVPDRSAHGICQPRHRKPWSATVPLAGKGGSRHSRKSGSQGAIEKVPLNMGEGDLTPTRSLHWVHFDGKPLIDNYLGGRPRSTVYERGLRRRRLLFRLRPCFRSSESCSSLSSKAWRCLSTHPW